MTTLVTGGAGFIGSFLVERLLDAGEDVVVLDDLSTGRAANLAHLAGRDRLRFCQGDIRDEALVGELVEGCGRVFHLGAVVGVERVVEQPDLTREVNTRGTRVVAEAAARQGAKLLFASSSEVYGADSRVPFREDDPDLESAKANVYAKSKLAGERLVAELGARTGMRHVILRFFNTTGPRQRPEYGMVLPRFVRRALLSEPITVYGDGGQTRTFVDVRDVVEAVLAIDANPASDGQTVNIGCDREVTVRELAHVVKEVTGSASEIGFIPFAESERATFLEQRRRVPRIDRMVELSARRPDCDLERVVRAVADYWRAELGLAR